MRGEEAFSFIAFSASPFVCIRPCHSTGDEVEVIATPGFAFAGPRDALGRLIGVGSATLRQRQRYPRVPVLGELLLLLFLAK